MLLSEFLKILPRPSIPAWINAISATIDIGGSHRVVVTDPLQSSVLDHTDVILRAPAFHPYGSQQYPSRAARLCIVEHQQLQALHKEFCQQLREGELDQQATSSSFNVLAELEAIRHKRDEAAQQNEAPVAGSVEGQSVPVKIETLVKQ
ncbi:hypothetical protein EMCRGX_G004608 [Ephydatia muelleri]